jgi:hypothetical protein
MQLVFKSGFAISWFGGRWQWASVEGMFLGKCAV